MTQILEDLDYFGLDDLLTSEELMTRETVKQFVAKAVLPDIEKHFANRDLPPRTDSSNGRTGVFWRQHEGLRMRRYEQRSLWIDHAGAGGGRLRLALLRFGSKRAVDVRDLCLRLRGTKKPLSARDGAGQNDRLLRSDRTRSSAPIRVGWKLARGAMGVDGCSTAPSAGSPMARSPTWPSFGPRSMRASPVFWWKRTSKDSPPTTSKASFRCAPRLRPN